MLGVYIHIPFCEKKCNYCAFSSFVSDEREKYVESLIEEINDFRRKYGTKYRNVDTIYFGGGTPSILSTQQFSKICQAIYNNFDVFNAEFTVEVNPNSINEEKFKCYKACNVNRISIGVQSLNDQILNLLGRLHNSQTAINSIKMARKYFKNISCDMIIGLPNQEKDYLKDLNTLVENDITHISTYMLQIESGTPFEKMVEKKELILDEDETIKLYDETVKFLISKGFNQYEVSNFAKTGFESKHNFKYWSGEEYVGFGLASHSYLEGCRTANASTFKEYYARVKSLNEKLEAKELIEEHLMLGLRCYIGINKTYLKNLGYDIEGNPNYKDFLQREVLIKKEDQIFLNPQYYSVNNFIIASLIP